MKLHMNLNTLTDYHLYVYFFQFDQKMCTLCIQHRWTNPGACACSLSAVKDFTLLDSMTFRLLFYGIYFALFHEDVSGFNIKWLVSVASSTQRNTLLICGMIVSLCLSFTATQRHENAVGHFNMMQQSALSWFKPPRRAVIFTIYHQVAISWKKVAFAQNSLIINWISVKVSL